MSELFPSLPGKPEFVEQIHASPVRIVLATTGGGGLALASLLSVPGASRTVLEGLVPYSAKAIDEFLGAAPENYCHERTGRAMAMAAFERARRLGRNADVDAAIANRQLAGVACTASLASDRPKRGEHRAHVAVQTASFTSTYYLELAKDRRSRAEEEQLVGALVLNAVAEACGLEHELPLVLVERDDVQHRRADAPPEWQELLLGERSSLAASGPTLAKEQEPAIASGKPMRVIFPGAFHPRHEGHFQMADIASRRLGAVAEYEISIENVDKPPLDYLEMQERAGQFAENETLWLTRAATFREKAHIFPGAAFVVGIDTLVRIAETKYYGGAESARDAAIAHLAERGCRFLAFGRLVAGRFQGLDDVDLPPALRAISEGVPADVFRADISSTEVRGAADGQ